MSIRIHDRIVGAGANAGVDRRHHLLLCSIGRRLDRPRNPLYNLNIR
jgi:hypothetical protein